MNLLTILEIIVSVALIILILLQERSGGLGGIFGGGGGGDSGFYQTRRGMEKMIFYSTVVLAIVFTVLALTNVLS